MPTLAEIYRAEGAPGTSGQRPLTGGQKYSECRAAADSVLLFSGVITSAVDFLVVLAAENVNYFYS